MTVRTLSLLDALKLDATNLDPQNFCGSGLTVHAIAAMFPLLEGKEFDELCLDMQSSGLQNAIVVLNGVLLDGRNRLRACAKTGVQPKYIDYAWRKDREDEWIVSQNLHRRSITPDQRVALVAKYYDWRNAEEMARQAQRGNLGTPTQQKVKTVEREKSPGQPEPAKSEHPIRDDIAQKAGVGGGKAKQAIAIAKTKPELLDDVVAGKTKLREAERQAKSRQDQGDADGKVKATARKTENKLAKVPSYITTATREMIDPIIRRLDLYPAYHDELLTGLLRRVLNIYPAKRQMLLGWLDQELMRTGGQPSPPAHPPAPPAGIAETQE